MAAKKVGEKWFVVKKDKSLGTRGYSTQQNALNAQKRATSNRGGKSTALAKRKSTTPAATTTKPKKKLTVGKGLDAYAAGGPAINRGLEFYQTRDSLHLITGLEQDYGGFSHLDGLHLDNLVRGYGGVVNRKIEKKLFQGIGIKGPRSKINSLGDLIDYLTYFGMTFFEAYQRYPDPREMNLVAYNIQNGINLNKNGFDSYDLNTMFMNKEIPYIVQKSVRKILREWF